MFGLRLILLATLLGALPTALGSTLEKKQGAHDYIRLTLDYLKYFI
jgi:hypothetical protein